VIGDIRYFHAHALNLRTTNERLRATIFDAAIRAFRAGPLRNITVISSIRSATYFRPPNRGELHGPHPSNTDGFEKLAIAYVARGAFERYQLPYHHRPPIQLRRRGRGTRSRR
jgi:UDP-glucose 4-epimerase